MPIWDPRIGAWLLFAYALSLAIALWAAWRAGPRAALTTGGWAFLALAALAAALSTRHLSIYAIAWFTWVAPLLAISLLGAIAASWWRRRPEAYALASAVVLVAGVSSCITRRAWALEIPARPGPGEVHWYPVGAVDGSRAPDSMAGC